MESWLLQNLLSGILSLDDSLYSLLSRQNLEYSTLVDVFFIIIIIYYTTALLMCVSGDW